MIVGDVTQHSIVEQYYLFARSLSGVGLDSPPQFSDIDEGKDTSGT